MNVIAQQAAALLEKAVAVLERKGWCTGYLEHPHTKQHCAIGALQVASLDRTISGWTPESKIWRKQPAVSLALRTLVAEAEGTGSVSDDATSNWQTVVNWNNEQETVEPVIEAMKHAAKDLANSDG